MKIPTAQLYHVAIDLPIEEAEVIMRKLWKETPGIVGIGNHGYVEVDTKYPTQV